VSEAYRARRDRKLALRAKQIEFLTVYPNVLLLYQGQVLRRMTISRLALVIGS
jgi:hypothetical protein